MSVEVADVKIMAKRFGFDDSAMSSIFDHFVKGGDLTSGGLFGAVTSFAQEVSDPDRASDLESDALRVLAVAAGRG